MKCIQIMNGQSCTELCEAFTFFLKNIYVQFDGMVYQHIVGILMGTYCAPLDRFISIRRMWHADRGRLLLRTPGPVPLDLAYVLLVEINPFPNLSLFYRTMLFEYPSVLSRFCFILLWDGLYVWPSQIQTSWPHRHVNDTSRYLDDIFTFDNPEFEKYIPDIYPAELQLNKANTSGKETSFLDLNIKVIGSYIHTSVYDKRDDFGFPIVLMVEWWRSQTPIVRYLHFVVG